MREILLRLPPPDGAQGGRFVEAASFNVAVIFHLLPRVPVYFRFNNRDEDFPAQSSILFRRSAELYLDMECLAIDGTFLTGLLINQAAKDGADEITRF